MKLILKISVFLFGLFFISCGGGKSMTAKNFEKETNHHKRIAVLPFESKLNLNDKEMKGISAEEIIELELAQGKEVQDAVEAYLVDKNLRVRIQSSSVTNSRLIDKGIDLAALSEHDISKLARILEVDAVVSGYLETAKPISEALATGLNIAKSVERNVLGSYFGSSINTSTNKGQCRIGLFEAIHGDRLWAYSEEIELGVGSTTQEMINKMMKSGAEKFPYKR